MRPTTSGSTAARGLPAISTSMGSSQSSITISTYLSQPDYPDPPALDPGQQQGIVYLEVWQRLVTHLEDPTIQEIALGGPDTAARLRTIAQVKVLTVPEAGRQLTCDDADRLLAQTGGGTLTTLQPADTPPDDDCVIPDPGSYTGRENHLYRVEVHDAGDVLGGSGSAFRIPLGADASAGSLKLTLGRTLSATEAGVVRGGVVTVVDDLGQRETLSVVDASGKTVTVGHGLATGYRVTNHAQVIGGAATFKWSRDNAAFAVAVTAVADDRVTLSLESLGRDVVTTLRDGDLVEVADDVSDLGPARGHLTYLVADPEADPPRVTLADPVPTRFAAPGGSPDRHLKLRKWDGLGTGQAAFDPLATPDMNLGDGVHIQFGGADLRPGDYWMFAARRADGSVQRLDASPPHGIVRHRCALAIVRWRTETRFTLAQVSAASRQAELGDVFATIAERLKVLRDNGTNTLDMEEVIALAKAAGASDAQIERIRRFLLESRGKTASTLEVVDDCRQPFDPLTDLHCDCDCTVSVGPGESIPVAIGRVPPSGGTVCLLAGVHDLLEPVDIRDRRGLTIRGVGGATHVRAHDLPVAFRFTDCDEIDIRDIVFMGGRTATDAGDARRQPVLDVADERRGRTTATERIDASEISGGAVETVGTIAPGASVDASTGPVPQFGGLVTFTDCRGIAVEGCGFLFAPGTRQELPGFGLVFADSTFLASRLAVGVRSAVTGVFAAEAAPGAGPSETGAPVAGPAPAPAAGPAPAPAAGPLRRPLPDPLRRPLPDPLRRPLLLRSQSLRRPLRPSHALRPKHRPRPRRLRRRTSRRHCLPTECSRWSRPCRSRSRLSEPRWAIGRHPRSAPSRGLRSPDRPSRRPGSHEPRLPIRRRVGLRVAIRPRQPNWNAVRLPRPSRRLHSLDRISSAGS